MHFIFKYCCHIHNECILINLIQDLLISKTNARLLLLTNQPISGRVIIPMGKEVSYFHGGLGGWTHEYEATLKIERGLVIKTSFCDSCPAAL